jgi:outer membrane protein W
MKRLTALVALLAFTTAAQAQYRNEPNDVFASAFDRYVTFSLSARYGLALPLGGQKGYIDRISPANLALEGEWLFPQRFSLGIKTGYQYNQQRLGRQVYDFGDQSISAVQTRTLTIIPAMVSASYYFAENSAAIRPYVQVAGGGAYVDFTNYYGTLTDQKTGFRGAAAPAIGLKYFGRRDQKFGAEVQAQYQHVFFNYDLLKNSSPSLMLSAGLVYRWY